MSKTTDIVIEVQNLQLENQSMKRRLDAIQDYIEYVIQDNLRNVPDSLKEYVQGKEIIAQAVDGLLQIK